MGYMYGLTYGLQQKSPHGTMVGSLQYNPDLDIYLPQISTQTHYESLASIHVDNSDTLNSTACIGMESLFRPYTTDPTNPSLPLYGQATGVYPFPSNKITAIELNPIQNNSDLSWILSPISGEYQGLKAKNMDITNSQCMSFKGPLIIEGWGYDIAGNPVPNSGNLIDTITDSQIPDLYGDISTTNNLFYPNYLTKSVFWPVGPLDMRWDKFRGVWVCPGMILPGAITGVGTLNPGSTGLLNLYVNDQPTGETIPIKNFFKGQNATITDGTLVLCGYDPLTNVWRPLAADCLV
jgi:hypothetical protein